MNVIETHQITKSYGKNDVVKGITLDVKRGEVFGFLGKNGAGKSTFINTLTGIIHPTSGEYFLFGEKGTHDKVKQRIGVMPDYVTFYSSLSPIRHLRLLSALSGKPVTKSQCMDTLKKVGLEKHANKKTSKFSFGMKKKLGIALAIIHDPELIFLDEPTSGLDAESVIMIQKLIQQLQSCGKTIFMTSHNLDEVEKICTRMAIMKEGEIVQIGTIDELRAYYRSTITVKVKHSAIPVDEKTNLYQWLDSTGTDLESADNHFTMCVSSEKKIADIIRALNIIKVDILRVEVEEPSLEEMFLEA
ncbi:ABC transporter ATP-binding protein [Rossellomorea sp. YZS02]|uniref:ABC transporter ATP-binding protein n=1 Tax=Rossellomorea sp. YZS02 TaxID=3097358 RepID=UPI002A12C748|nr:ABC transporter ATP-binding protein [Rossellomorea sp. YZS02]MDX8342353.1 ABC transporter ATP-binding protein [Rossellomorea sp. YZS02]